MKTICLVMLATFMGLSISCFSQKEMDEMWGKSDLKLAALKNGKAKLFDEGNFGMFIHWGLFSSLGGVWNDKTYYGIGEWIMNPRMANIPRAEYMETAKKFNPKDFDAKKIAQLAKDAGMKYIIVTSKHHEGFAMFDSKVDSFNIVRATPFARDPMKELAAACQKLDLGFGFYYSHNQDWTTPGGTGGPKTDKNGKAVTFEDYFYRKAIAQIKEICTNYGSIDFVWFDTPGDMKKDLVVEIVKTVEKLQPKAMMCSRVGHGLGDYASIGDMEIPTHNILGLWESCDTNNDSWSYAWYDNNFKSPKEILHRLIATIARGGSYLFNVGPNEFGVVPEIGATFLRKTGTWIKKYPKVIYNAGSSPWGYALPWGDITTNGNSLYLSVFDWPKDGKLYIPSLENQIESVTILGNDKKKSISYKKENEWTVFDVPYKSPDELVSVIEIKIKNMPKEMIIKTALGVYPNITTTLLTEFGVAKNCEQKSIRWMEKFGEWKKINQVSNWKDNGAVTWTVNVQKPGYYYLDLSYKGTGRLVWKTETDENIKVQNQQAATEKYVFYKMGILEFKKSGIHTITTSLIEGDRNTSSLSSLSLNPIN